MPRACLDALRRLDDYLDRRLSLPAARLVEAHLKVCAHCAAQFRFEASVVTELRRKLRRIELPPGLAGLIRARLAVAAAGGRLP